MQHNLQIFKNEQFGEVRTIISEDGEPRFCLADVCNALNLKSYHVKNRLGDDIVSNEVVTDSKGRDNHTLFVNEEGLYATIFESRKPEAKAFRHWVFSEVLPSIRKTGHYGTANDLIEDTEKWRDDITAVAGKFGMSLRTADVVTMYGAYMTSLGPEQDTSMSELAKSYGMEYRAFCDLLARNALIERDGNKWACTLDRNISLPMTRTYEVSTDGKPTSSYVKWTTFGRAFVLYILAKHNGITPVDGCFDPEYQKANFKTLN